MATAIVLRRRKNKPPAIPRGGLEPSIQSASSESADVRGRRTVALNVLLSSNDWKRRCVDRVEVLDEVGMRWTRSIEMRLPNLGDVLGVPSVLRELPIPLALHSKRVLTGFEMSDVSGQRLSMLTRYEDQPIVEDALILLAQEVVGRPLPTAARNAIMGIVRTSPEVASDHLRQLHSSIPDLLPKNDHDDEQQARRRAFLDKTLKDLISNFFLMTSVRYFPDSTVDVEYSFTDVLRRPDRSGLKRLVPTRSHSTASQSIKLHTGAAPSFHFELQAPDELDVRTSRRARHANSATCQGARALICEGRYLSFWIHDQEWDATEDLPFRLKLHRPGLVSLTASISTATTLGMTGALLARVVADVRPASDVAAPVVVAVPALFRACGGSPSGSVPVLGTEHPNYGAASAILVIITGAILMVTLGAIPDGRSRCHSGERSQQGARREAAVEAHGLPTSRSTSRGDPNALDSDAGRCRAGRPSVAAHQGDRRSRASELPPVSARCARPIVGRGVTVKFGVSFAGMNRLGLRFSVLHHVRLRDTSATVGALRADGRCAGYLASQAIRTLELDFHPKRD